MNTMVKQPVRPSIEPEGKPQPKLKLVTTIIRPEKLGAVTNALNHLDIVGGFTVTEARGSGRFAVITRFFRGIPFVVQLASELKIEVIVPDHRVDAIMDTILKHARTGNVGDGKIWVTEVATVLRIRTGERGLAAL